MLRRSLFGKKKIAPILLMHFDNNMNIDTSLTPLEVMAARPEYMVGKFQQAFKSASDGLRLKGMPLSEYSFNTESVTVDFWLLVNNNTKATWEMICENTSYYSYPREITIVQNTKLSVNILSYGITSYDFNLGNTRLTNGFHHFAFTYKHTSRILKLYVDGTFQSEIGPLRKVEDFVNGWRFSSVGLDELRVTPGIVWDKNFAPPTEPY